MTSARKRVTSAMRGIRVKGFKRGKTCNVWNAQENLQRVECAGKIVTCGISEKYEFN